MSSYFFEYLESIQVVKQTHQISALNSVSFRDFFKPKYTNFLAAITESSIKRKGEQEPDMTSMTQHVVFIQINNRIKHTNCANTRVTLAVIFNLICILRMNQAPV